MKKILTSFWLCCLLLPFLTALPVRAQEEAAPFEAAAKHVMAIELSTGKILYEKDSQTASGIGAITKLLTAYLVYEALEEGKLEMTTTVAISNYAYNLTYDTSIPNVPLDARSYKVEQLLTAMLVASSNSAAIALAEEIGGTEAKFVDKMTAKLKDWGIEDAKLVNASGLNNSVLGNYRYPDSADNDENMLSARSVAIIAQRLLLDFPQVTKLTSRLSASWPVDQTITSWNYMLEGGAYSRAGIKGLIPASTEAYGNSFVSAGQENDMQVITVVLNADGSDTNPYAPYTVTNDLLNYIAENFYLAPLIKKGQAFDKSKITIKNGKAASVAAVAKSDFNVVQQAGSEKTEARFQPSQKEFQAPVDQNSQIGTLTFQDDGYLAKPPSMAMVAENTVPRANFLKVWWNGFVDWVNKEL